MASDVRIIKDARLSIRCNECDFSTTDIALAEKHSCDVTEHGGFCEDYPACGHEMNDCNGLLYGSDEAIKEDAMKHAYCEHEHGFCDVDERTAEEMEND